MNSIRLARRPVVVALHCSGVDGQMWRTLRELTNGRMQILTPSLYGARDGAVWHGEFAFSIDEEAALVMDAMANIEQPVHLVGHSYGGAVALAVALASATRIASLTLFEPSLFALLSFVDARSHQEISGVADDVVRKVSRGDLMGAMAQFVDYWGGEGSWGAMKPEAKRELLRWSPKVALDFHALLTQSVTPEDCVRLTQSSLILTGSRSPQPARSVAAHLRRLLPNCRLQEFEDAGHMAPFTHRVAVAQAMVAHIMSVAAAPDSEASRLLACA